MYTLPDSFTRVFSENQLSIGLLTPLEAYPDSPFPGLQDHQKMAKLAEQAGFSSIWIRDVPFYAPNFGDTGQMLDPFVYAGYLAASTEHITLGTAGIILPLKDPVVVAKQAVSTDYLSGGRFILGVSTGDRPAEYPAFGAEFDNRAERYRESIDIIKTLHTEHFPRFSSQHYGNLNGHLDMHPKPINHKVPMIAVGRSRQPIEWLAKNLDAWIWSVDDAAAIKDIVASLKINAGEQTPPAYGYATFFDLDPNPNAPYQRYYNIVRIGRNALLERLKRHREIGVNHIALNLKPSRRSAKEVIEEMGEYVLTELN